MFKRLWANSQTPGRRDGHAAGAARPAGSNDASPGDCDEAATFHKRLKCGWRKFKALQAGDIDPDRLAQEVALLAAGADVTEEVERFDAHIASALGLPIQRFRWPKLDFMAEFNREANTLCSKSGSIALTNAGLALKGLIDQWREQSANIE